MTAICCTSVTIQVNLFVGIRQRGPSGHLDVYKKKCRLFFAKKKKTGGRMAV